MPAKIRVSNVRDAIEVTFPNYNFAIVATSAEWREYAVEILSQACALLTQVPADGAVAPIKCAECGDEILPICEACAGDMRRR